MSTFWLVLLGSVSGAAAGLLAGLIGFGGGVVVVPVVFYGLVEAGTRLTWPRTLQWAPHWRLSFRLRWSLH
jgi:hypothetical protein